MTDEIQFDVDADWDDDDESGLYVDDEKASETGQQVVTQRGDSSDEVDPRKLYRDPSLSELRWYYRRTFASSLVDKPILDAFKNGFEFEDEEKSEEAREMLENPRFDGDEDGFIAAHKMAERKARRDGFALIFLGTRERGGELHRSPISQTVDVQEVSHLKVWTIDDLSNGTSVVSDQIQEAYDIETTEYEVRQTGIVIDTRIGSPTYRTPLGYVIDTPTGGQFIHRDRVMHYVWNESVDGDYDHGEGIRRYQGDSTLGQFEGDSILVRSYDLMKGLSKGNWAIMQALFRNASHLYEVNLPEDADDDDLKEADRATRNINSRSALITPHGYEVDQHESGGEMEVEQHYEAIFNQICANHEMTKSVLFGTQTGTVSGSETDIKNYFSKVNRYQETRAETKILQYLTRYKRMTDSRTDDEYDYDIDIRWNPIFKVDKDTRLEMYSSMANAASTLISSWAMTPDEARELLDSEFVQVELDDLTESQYDVFDRIQLAQSGQGPQAIASEREMETGERGMGTSTTAEGGRVGGREEGQTGNSENPAADSLERLAQLHEDGYLTEDEFETVKEDIIQ